MAELVHYRNSGCDVEIHAVLSTLRCDILIYGSVFPTTGNGVFTAQRYCPY